MRIGAMIGGDRKPLTIDDIVTLIKGIEEAGLDNVWMANIRSHDAILTLTVAARAATRIGVGTAVTPTFPRHPIAMAQQALSAAGATQGRFVLGIGLSHKPVMENLYGISYDKPAVHMREYLKVLMPLLAGETVNFNGERYHCNDIAIDIPGASAPKVVVAALGPVMLRLAGSLADGTNTWMVGLKTMETHIVPRLTTSAQSAGRRRPMVVGGFPIALTNDKSRILDTMREPLSVYGNLASYRAMLDREGVAEPVDLALVGDEAQLRKEIARIKDCGVTDFMAAIWDAEPGGFERTLEFLASI